MMVIGNGQGKSGTVLPTSPVFSLCVAQRGRIGTEFRRHASVGPSLRRKRRLIDSARGSAAFVTERKMAAAAGWITAPGNLGSGREIGARFGGAGTIGCVGTTTDGVPCLITTEHVIPPDDVQAISLGAPAGRAGQAVEELVGSELYGSDAMNPTEEFQVEVTRIDDLPKGYVLHGGLPDGSSFSVSPTRDTFSWLQGSQVRSYGFGNNGWRTGTVSSLFPRRTDVPLTGLCLVAEDTLSADGDSGSLWVARRGAEQVAIGLHWGWTLDAQGVRHALVTELQAALAWIGVREVKGDAAWSMVVS
jgi:hypothetical protein